MALRYVSGGLLAWLNSLACGLFQWLLLLGSVAGALPAPSAETRARRARYAAAVTRADAQPRGRSKSNP